MVILGYFYYYQETYKKNLNIEIYIFRFHEYLMNFLGQNSPKKVFCACQIPLEVHPLT